MWGDPHVIGAYRPDLDPSDPNYEGGKYDFHKAGFYNLLSDKAIDMTARTDASTANPGTTVIRELGFTLGEGDAKRRIQLETDPSQDTPGKVIAYSVDANGVKTPINLPIADGASVALGEGYSLARSGGVMVLFTPEYIVQIDSQGGALNVAVNTTRQGVKLDNQLPDGILGETFDEDKVAVTGLKQAEAHYQRTGLFNGITATA